MKVVLLAGGFGTRISEESILKPKPMIEIGGMPILWHIIKYYHTFGFNDFIICGGYKINVIKEFFNSYYLFNSDVTFDYAQNNKIIIHNNKAEDWKITVIDTGYNTMTGGRLKRISHLIDGDDFLMTYGDGVSDININELIKYHYENKKIVTLSAVQVGGRFGALQLNNNKVESFVEKKKDGDALINGGFMVLNKKVFNYIKDDTIMLEREPFEKICEEGQMVAYKHYGFWQCMDTLRDKNYLEDLIAAGKAPWIKW